MPDGRAAPQRTCVGCRIRTAKSQLLRVVAIEGVLTPDPRGRSPGRGAHLHPDLVCLDLADRRRAFPRALRLGGPLGSDRVRAFLAATPGVAGSRDGRDDGSEDGTRSARAGRPREQAARKGTSVVERRESGSMKR